MRGNGARTRSGGDQSHAAAGNHPAVGGVGGRLQQQAKSDEPGALHSVLDESEQVAIEAIPQQAGLPTRSCQAKHAFRFLGLEPGRYTLRFRAEDFQEKRIEGVIVEKGKTTWLAPVSLERTAEPASSDKPRP